MLLSYGELEKMGAKECEDKRNQSGDIVLKKVQVKKVQEQQR